MKVMVDMPVAGVRKGDAYWEDGQIVWTAQGDAEETADGWVRIVVQFRDGGITRRYWRDGDVELNIERGV